MLDAYGWPRDLGRLVTQGRREEFSHFEGFRGVDVPDPQAESTFRSSKLDWSEAERPGHRETLALYRELLRLRGSLPALKERRRDTFRSAYLGGEAIAMRYFSQAQVAEQRSDVRNQKSVGQDRESSGRRDLLGVANLKGDLDLDLNANDITRPPEGHRWQVVLSTDDMRFGGPQDEAEVMRLVDRNRMSAAGPLVVALKAVSSAL